MQRKPLMSLVGILSVLMGGCQFIPSLPFFGGDNASSPSPTPVAIAPASPKGSPVTPRIAGSPLSSPRAGASPLATVKAAPLSPPITVVLNATPAPANPAAVGLTASLPATEVLRNNPQGRSDPFATVAIQPLVKEPTGGAAQAITTPTNQRPIPSLPQIPLPPLAAFPVVAPRVITAAAPKVVTAAAPRTTTAATSRTTTAAAPRTTTAAASNAARGATTSNTTSARGGTASTAGAGTTAGSSQAFVPQLPALPDPSLARLVEVSGIVDVEGTSPKAIIKAPNETSSRYVSPGERLSDGLILVKRIEITGPGGPVVVLEQFGVEVTRRVGDRPPTGSAQTGGRPS